MADRIPDSNFQMILIPLKLRPLSNRHKRQTVYKSL